MVRRFQAARKAIQDVLERKLEDIWPVRFRIRIRTLSQDLKFDLSSSKELRACIELLKCNGLGPQLLPTSMGERVLRDKGRNWSFAGFRREDPADIVRCSDGQVQDLLPCILHHRLSENLW